jgi:cytochrome c556
MKFQTIASIIVVGLLAATVSMAEDKNEENRQKIRKMAAQTLQDLYKLQPNAKAAAQKAAGAPAGRPISSRVRIRRGSTC